jgi:hypothetical protein
MKKALVVLLILAVAGGAFAQVTVSGGVAAQFSPIGVIDPVETSNTQDTETLLPVAGFGKVDGDRNAGVELQLNVAGTLESGQAGFLIQLRPKYTGGFGGTLYVGDNAELWFKPLDWIRIDAGRFSIHDIRGRMASGHWFGDFTIPRAGENDIFQTFDGKLAVLASVKPEVIDGLGIYLMYNNVDLYSRNANGTLTWTPTRRAEYVYENIQTAISYALSDIGLARVQYVGAAPSASSRLNNDRYLPTGMWSITAPRFEAAFALTAISGLTLDLGVKFYVPFSGVTWPHESVLGSNDNASWPAPPADTQYGFGIGSSAADGKYQAPHMVAVGVKYELLPITLFFRFDAKFLGYGEESISSSGVVVGNGKLDLGSEMRAWLTANYKINDTFSAQAEGGIVYADKSKATVSTVGVSQSWTIGSDAFLYGFGLGLQTTFATDCWIRVGATFTSGKGMGISINPLEDAANRALPYASSFSIPILMQVSF